MLHITACFLLKRPALSQLYLNLQCQNKVDFLHMRRLDIRDFLLPTAKKTMKTNHSLISQFRTEIFPRGMIVHKHWHMQVGGGQFEISDPIPKNRWRALLVTSLHQSTFAAKVKTFVFFGRRPPWTFEAAHTSQNGKLFRFLSCLLTIKRHPC